MSHAKVDICATIRIDQVHQTQTVYLYERSYKLHEDLTNVAGILFIATHPY